MGYLSSAKGLWGREITYIKVLTWHQEKEIPGAGREACGKVTGASAGGE